MRERKTVGEGCAREVRQHIDFFEKCVSFSSTFFINSSVTLSLRGATGYFSSPSRLALAQMLCAIDRLQLKKGENNVCTLVH